MSRYIGHALEGRMCQLNGNVILRRSRRFEALHHSLAMDVHLESRSSALNWGFHLVPYFDAVSKLQNETFRQSSIVDRMVLELE